MKTKWWQNAGLRSDHWVIWQAECDFVKPTFLSWLLKPWCSFFKFPTFCSLTMVPCKNLLYYVIIYMRNISFAFLLFRYRFIYNVGLRTSVTQTREPEKYTVECLFYLYIISSDKAGLDHSTSNDFLSLFNFLFITVLHKVFNFPWSFLHLHAVLHFVNYGVV